MTGKAPPRSRTRKRIEKTDIVDASFIFEALASAAPKMEARTSVRQLFAFMAVVRAEAMGQSLLLSDIRKIEDPETGESIVGQSIQQTFAMLLEPSDREPRALGWVTQETDPDDKRRKFLKLTDKGHAVAAAMIGAAK
jgi:hypothetical protein